jgi:ABC transporter substrate binding protein (PQQ-dependent alcohol dehydrogenase system)
MITRLLIVLCAFLPPQMAGAQDAPTKVSFAYVFREADAAYEPHRAYTGLTLRDRHRPIDGANTAIRESRILARALNLSVALAEMPLGDGDAVSAIRGARRSGTHVFLLDLPIEDVEAAGKAFAAEPGVLLFNIRHTADRLRGEACSPTLFHTIPSEAMLTDAIGEFLKARGWQSVLVLLGGNAADQGRAASFRRSAQKFGLSIIEERPFALGNDPRQREQNNIALLTGDARYDVVFLADEEGEFGRYVPFSTYLPRPVVGSSGLGASAWHWAWERNGAPQLNQRFDRVASRQMADTDWAAWAAVRSVLEVIQRMKAVDYSAIRDELRSADFAMDLYKGLPGAFRPWDNQLRQPILLHTHDAVIGWAPLPGFLHRTNTLDSLGTDAPESACRM